MSEQKIDRTFTRVMDEINRLQKAFQKGGKFEQAVAELGGNIAWFNDINEAFDNLYDTLEDGHMGAVLHLQNENVTESKQINEGVLDADDDDGFMARSQLYFMARDAIQLHGIIGDTDDLEPWVQSKIAQAAQGIDAVRRYTEYNAMNDSMPMEDTPPMPKKRPSPHRGGDYSELTADEMKAAVARVFGNMKDSPDEFFKKRLGEEQIDEGKVATWALALLLGLGSYAGLEATSAKHTPLGQALEYAAEQGDEEAAKLFKNIDAYVDSDPQSLVNWRMSNEKIFDRFDESASLMEDEPHPIMRFLAPFFGGVGSDVYDQPHAGAWDPHSHDDEHADKPAEFMATRNTAADNVLKSLQKANPEKRYNIYQEILKNLTKPGGFVYENEALMEHPLVRIIKNLMKKGDELGNKISDEDLAAATATAATLGGLGAATRPRRTDTETPDEFMRKRVGEGDYGKKKKKKKKYYDESYQDRYDRVKATANDIKINRELATMPQDAARKVSGNADYSHDSNPAYAAKKAARKDGIPHKDIVTRMKPNPADGKFKWGRDQLSDDVSVSDKTYKTRDEAKKAAIMNAARTGGDWEVIEEGMEFDEKRNDDLQTVAKDLFANAKASAKKKAK